MSTRSGHFETCGICHTTGCEHERSGEQDAAAIMDEAFEAKAWERELFSKLRETENNGGAMRSHLSSLVKSWATTLPDIGPSHPDEYRRGQKRATIDCAVMLARVLGVEIKGRS